MEFANLMKGERFMSRAFIAQYAAFASLQVEGVAYLEPASITGLKEALGFSHEGAGVVVNFSEQDSQAVHITLYPVLYFGEIIPEISFQMQEKVKAEVELYTGLLCETVDVHVKNIVERPLLFTEEKDDFSKHQEQKGEEKNA